VGSKTDLDDTKKRKASSTWIRTSTPSDDQPVARRYTDCVIPALTITEVKKHAPKKSFLPISFHLYALWLNRTNILFTLFPLLVLQPNSVLDRLHESFRFTSVARSTTVGRTPWTGD
jgi:hypothetical protein